MEIVELSSLRTDENMSACYLAEQCVIFPNNFETWAKPSSLINRNSFCFFNKCGNELCLCLASCVCVLCFAYVRCKYNVRRHEQHGIY